MENEIIPQEFLNLFELKNIEYVVDEFENLIMQDAIMRNEDLKVKLSRDVTHEFNNWINNKVKKKEKITLNLKGVTRCLPINTKILMEDFTLKNIQDCKIGDKLWTINEQTNKLEIKPILKLWDNGEKEIYEIITKGNKNILATNEHKFLKGYSKMKYDGKFKNKNSKFISKLDNYKWTELKNFKKGDLIGTIKFDDNLGVKTNYSLNTLELLGFVIADANIIYSVCFGLKKIDKINYLFDLINNSDLILNINQQIIKNKKSSYYISNKIKNKKSNLTSLLEDLNLFGKNSYQKFIPNNIKNATEIEIYAFLSGLFNGDCSITKDKGFSYSTMSLQLFEDLKILLNRLNIEFTERKRIPNYKYLDNKIHISYEINITRFDSMEKLYKNLNLIESRKIQMQEFFKYYQNKDKTKNYSTYKLYCDNNIIFRRIKEIKKIKKDKTYDLTIEDNHNYIVNNFLVSNSGKSLIGLKITLKIKKNYDYPFNVERIVCANQKEYRLKLKDVEFGEVFQIDEKAFSNNGMGSMIELQQLKDVENITAKKNIHTIYITPRMFLNTGAELGLSYWGKDTKNWISRFLLYSLKSANPSLLGYVVFDVGEMFREFGCYMYKFNGGCTNPNRLSFEDINNLYNGDVLKYSYCIPKDYDKEKIIEGKISCPFYNVCNHPLNAYEHKKDKWIEKELKGGVDERTRDRYETAIKLIEKLGIIDNDRIIMKARNGKDLYVKIKLQTPSITNSKYSGEELKELMALIQSMSNIDMFKEVCKQIEINPDTILEKLDRQ